MVDNDKELIRQALEQLLGAVLADIETPSEVTYADEQLRALQLLALSVSELPKALHMIAIGGMSSFVATMANELRKGGK